MQTFTITANNGTKRHPILVSYEFSVVGDLEQPGALRLESIIYANGNRETSVHLRMVPNSAYRQAIAAAKAI